MPNTNPGASSDLHHPALLLTSLEMNHPLSWVLSVHLGLALTPRPKPGTLGCCSSSLCWLVEAAPQNQVLAHRASPTVPSPAFPHITLGSLCEPHNQGSSGNTGAETGGFLFLARGRRLLQVSEGGAGTVWLLRCSGYQPMTRL